MKRSWKPLMPVQLSDRRRKFALVALGIMLITTALGIISFSQDKDPLQERNAESYSTIPIESRDGNLTPIKGLSSVEIHVRSFSRPKVLHEQVGRDNTFDLYLSYTDRFGKPRVSLVYQGVSMSWISEAGDSVWIDVAAEDVSEIMALEMAGEFRLVKSSASTTHSDSDLADPLGDRKWIVDLLGTDRLEMVQ